MGRPKRNVVTFTDATVPVPLDEKQQRMKARQLAELCDKIDSERAAAKADAGGARKKIRALEDQRRLLAECVRTGSEKQNAQAELFGSKSKATTSVDEEDEDSDLEADDLDSARLGEEDAQAEADDRAIDKAKDAPEPNPFTASQHGPTMTDERDAFLANKSATRAPVTSILDGRTQAERDADANEALGEIIEGEAAKLEADAAPAPMVSSVADFGDPWDAPLEDITPPATTKSKGTRKPKNGEAPKT